MTPTQAISTAYKADPMFFVNFVLSGIALVLLVLAVIMAHDAIVLKRVRAIDKEK